MREFLICVNCNIYILLLKMSRNYREIQANAQITLNYVNGILAIEGEDQEDKNAAIEDALAYCYSYLIQKKMEWSIHVQKLAELFLELAFEIQKHTKIKEVLKQYRAITQNQHPDSLRHILEYYRDNKLQTILEDQISEENLQFIRSMRNIEDDQVSSEIILSSFNPEIKNQKQELRQKLKIVWEGYKSIIDIVKVNLKLESVYKATLKKIFEFVDKYNRKQEFKSFCDYLRSVLKVALNKRDRSEQQRGFYIDIEKQDVNTNNIQIRLEQFNVTTKLGLWQQSFQILEDIKQLMRVRKGPVKNAMKCSYFEKLALVFRKSNYWHYHAFALFNYYTIFITKSKLAEAQKTKLSDKLLLSVLCIPPYNLQTLQKNKENREKIAQMMIYNTKIPEREQMYNMMVSRGIVENASKQIKQLWYFMFLEFDLSSLNKGLQLLKKLEGLKEYKQYIQLLEDILIYRQLISVAQVYQKMKYSSLFNLIPLPEKKVEKILLQCHNRKVIDFNLDEKRGIISFQQKIEETNPLEQFYHSYVEIALLTEETKELDRKHIINKSIEFTKDSENYYWTLRQYKITEYEKKLKKPRDQLTFKERALERKIRNEKQKEENERKVRQSQLKQQIQKNKQQLIDKRIVIQNIIKIKEQRVVRVGAKRIENLEDEDISEVPLEVFKELLQQTQTRVVNDNENRNKKKFVKIDYAERERRQLIKDKIVQKFKNQKQGNEQQIIENARKDFEEKQKLKVAISAVAPEVKDKIDQHYLNNKEQFENDLSNFKKKLDEEFKQKILKRAKQLKKAYEQAKLEEQKRRKQIQLQEGTTPWTFKSNAAKQSTSNQQDGAGWKRKTAQQLAQAARNTQAISGNQGYKKDTWFRSTAATGKSDTKTEKKSGGFFTKQNTFSGLNVQDTDDVRYKKQVLESNQGPQRQEKGWFNKKSDKRQVPAQQKEQSWNKKENKQEKSAWGFKRNVEQQQEQTKSEEKSSYFGKKIIQQTKQEEQTQNKKQQKEQKSSWGFGKKTAKQQVKQEETNKTSEAPNKFGAIQSEKKGTWGKTSDEKTQKRAEPELVLKNDAAKKKGKGWS